MAPRATDRRIQATYWLNVSRVCPRGIGDLTQGSDMRAIALLGSYVTMAIQAPAHAEWGHLANLIHEVDSPVTLRAPDSGRHVDAMIEVRIVG